MHPSVGIVEILLPDADSVAKLGYGKYRWPPEEGERAIFMPHTVACALSEDGLPPKKITLRETHASHNQNQGR